MDAPAISPPYAYAQCPLCERPVRFTLGVGPDGLPQYDEEAIKRGTAAHLLHGCEAVAR